MLDRSQEGERKAKDELPDQLTQLKAALIDAIGTYLRDCDSKPVKVSLHNMAGPRLHYNNGEEGRLRAEDYQIKIERSTAEYYDFIQMIYVDLQNAAKNSSVGIVEKATKYLGDGYTYLVAKIYGSSDADYPVQSTPNDLGTSEVLAGLLAKAMCDFLKISDYKEHIYNELLRTNEESARLYVANKLNRQINAIHDWLEGNKPGVRLALSQSH